MLVALATALLVLPPLGWAPFQLGSLWCVGIIGTALVLLQLLRNLPILLLFAGLAIGSIFFPPLSLVMLAVAIYLVITRIGYLVEHWQVVMGGFAFYALAWGFDVAWLTVLDTLYGLAVGVLEDVPWGGRLFLAMASAPVALGLDRVLRLAYARGYTPWQVATIALTAPAVLLLLLLAVAGLAADLVPDFAPDLAPDPPPDMPPLARVHGGMGGDPPPLVKVVAHMRSDPDGLLENNLSYQGPLSPDSAHAPGTHAVAAHVRTAPDGIAGNNLSPDGVTGGGARWTQLARDAGADADAAPEVPGSAAASTLSGKRRPRPAR